MFGIDPVFCLHGGVLLQAMGNGDAFFVSYFRATVAKPLMEHNDIDPCAGIEWDQRPRR